MKSELTIGKVLKPRGLKGELKFETYSSDPARFCDLKKLSIDKTEYTVLRISIEGNVAYCVLDGVYSVEKAESLRGKLVTCNRDDLPALDEGEHYIVDMIGLAVVVNGEVKGRISDILQYGSADVYVVKNGDVTFSFPAIKGVVKQVDIDGGKIVVDDFLFDRVVVYN